MNALLNNGVVRAVVRELYALCIFIVGRAVFVVNVAVGVSPLVDAVRL